MHENNFNCVSNDLIICFFDDIIHIFIKKQSNILFYICFVCTLYEFFEQLKINERTVAVLRPFIVPRIFRNLLCSVVIYIIFDKIVL